MDCEQITIVEPSTALIELCMSAVTCPASLLFVHLCIITHIYQIGLCVCMMLQCMKHIHYEDENTRYVDIGPVNKVINMLCCWFEDPDSMAFKK